MRDAGVGLQEKVLCQLSDRYNDRANIVYMDNF